MRTGFFAFPSAVAAILFFVAHAAFAHAAERIPVTFAAFSFAGKINDLAELYPYSSRLAYQADPDADGGRPVRLKRNDNPAIQSRYAIGPEEAAFHRALREAHYRIAAPLTHFELRQRVESDDIESFHRYGLTTALVHESVHTVPMPEFNRQTRSWENGRGVMAFFKLAFLVLILDYEDNSLRDAVPFTCIGKKLYAAAPTDEQLLSEVRKLYLGESAGEGPGEGIVTRQLAHVLPRVSLDASAGKTIQVGRVSFGDGARDVLGDLLDSRQRADYFISMEFSARLASVLNARVMPPLFDNSINQIVLQQPDVEARAYAIRPGDYRLELEIHSFGNAVAQRTTAANVYALSATARLGVGEWSREMVLPLGNTRPIPKAMADGWPFGINYFDALTPLCQGATEQIREARQAAGWNF